ncbi:phosphatase PAP2 family protein [Kitasatospora sp. MMS16-BH015]|uniref:phosphatase PAP2 family protein n=1 Tax=Kitasatospora sp. MMS16-BH015 TaxID=2018025 RepID=UPI000CA3DE3C|nr:phosphatase PAP2 family protein [Kitasatospora sp. MMS16-BH015]AUG80208.1 phosphatase PAP2 family protein [Kitasatospora sp. MMS16-BH015]
MNFIAYDGSGIDGGLYTRVLGWADGAPSWLDQLIKVWSAIGLGLFALFMLYAWWRARSADSVVMARVLASPVIVVVAYAANSVLKGLVEENRPCQQLNVRNTLEACPGAGDWSFPSNHSVIAFAAATALVFAYRRIGWYAYLAAALMAASRVWVGVHYPHDVAVGALVGVLVGLPLALLAGRAAPLVDRLRGGPLGPFLGTGPAPAFGVAGR